MKRTLTPIQVAKELRKNMTPSERILWDKLRANRLGYKFVRQKPIIIDKTNTPVKFYVVDFYCAQKKLIIELDGKIHETQIAEDFNREQELRKKGFHIIRFKNEELDAVENVLERIKTALNCLPPGPLSIPIFIGTERGKMELDNSNSSKRNSPLSTALFAQKERGRGRGSPFFRTVFLLTSSQKR